VKTMIFDITLPLVLFFLNLAVIWLYKKFEPKIKKTVEEKELSIKEAIFLVILIAIFVSVVVFVPGIALKTMFIFVFSLSLFTFVYIGTEKWYIAILPPIIFLVLYFFQWNIYWLNLFAIIFAILITVYLGSFFNWETTLVFAVLLTSMDIFLIFVTGSMVQAAKTLRGHELPIAIELPIIPILYTNNGQIASMLFGLGDLFFAGLLSIQTLKKFEEKTAIISAIAMSASLFAFEALILTYSIHVFPGTLMIICGWLITMAFATITKRKKQHQIHEH